jgi:hypothetical protein
VIHKSSALVILMLEGVEWIFHPFAVRRSSKELRRHKIDRYKGVKRYLHSELLFSKKKLDSVLHRINLISPCLNF